MQFNVTICKVIILSLILKIAIAAEDQASHCRRQGSTETCDSFQQCCARHCQGPHDSSCTEGEGTILRTKCFCEGNSNDGESNIGLSDMDSVTPTTGRRGSSGASHGGHRHETTPDSDTDGRGSSGISHGGRRHETTSGSDFGTVGDHTSVCRARHSNCPAFTACCRERCPNPIAVSCTPGELNYAVCRCAGGGHEDSGPRLPGRESGSDSSSGSLSLGADHTASCKTTARNDCLQFRRCCSTRCDTKYTSRCSGDGHGQLLSAYCRCTSTTTTTLGRGESLPSFPRHNSTSGFHDFTETCRDSTTRNSCDSFNQCCRMRCANAREKSQSCNSSNERITSATCTCTI